MSADPPRVIQVSSYYPPHVGGVEFCVSNISAELAARGRLVTVLTSSIGASDNPSPNDLKPPHGPDIRRLRAAEIAHTPVIPALPWALWRESRGALIHLHFGQVFTDVVTSLVALARGRPLVAHFHMDTPPSGRFGALFGLYKKVALGWLLRRADAVIAVSAAHRELLLRRYRVAPERAVVIPNGVGEQFFSRPAQQTSARPFRLLYVGRLAAQKNLPLLLRTIEELGPDVHLDLVGDGELRADISDRARALPDGRVTLWGSLSGGDLLRRYREADAFILTSDAEGLPLALLEAMAAGLPVIASDVRGLREHVQGVGMLVDDRTPAGFAAAITRLRDEKGLREGLGTASRQHAAGLRWKSLVHRVERVYADVVAGTRPTSS